MGKYERGRMGKVRPDFTFEDLDVWKMARDVRKNIATIVRSFPREESNKLVDQMIRSSRSVTANIAEGYGRFYFKENIQFCRQARGSLFELIDHLTVALDEGYINNIEYIRIRNECYSLVKMLNGYIKYLRSRSNESK